MTIAVKEEDAANAWDVLQLCLGTGSAVVEDEAPRPQTRVGSLRRLGGKRMKL